LVFTFKKLLKVNNSLAPPFEMTKESEGVADTVLPMSFCASGLSKVIPFIKSLALVAVKKLATEAE
jgi:hypothetical protein